MAFEKINIDHDGESALQGARLGNRSREQEKLSISELKAKIKGRVITPQDAEYDAARMVAVGGIDRRPMVIVRAADAEDVARVVTLARETGLELAVRSGGHSAAGHGVTEGGIVLDLKDMKKIEIDLKSRTAWAQAGLTAGEYTRAAAEHGLATGFGDTATVGIGGITLGGGVGYLTRKHGLTIDQLLAAEMVTADGSLLQVDANSHPDLFWAIRGGGGNFGVVTRFKYQLHPVDPFTGGMLILPAAPENIEAFIACALAAPEELSSIVNIMPAPPMPFLPPELHGSLVIMAMMAYTGAAEDALKALAPFREIAKPLADMVRPMKYIEMYPPEDPNFHPTMLMRSLFIDHFDRAAARTIVDFLNKSNAMIRVAQLRVLGGAVARVPAGETAYAHRKSRIMVAAATFYKDPEDRVEKETWVNDFSAALYQGNPGVYVNFLTDEGQARVREAYPGATWERLAAVKAKYDPENLFKLNQNIPPRVEANG